MFSFQEDFLGLSFFLPLSALSLCRIRLTSDTFYFFYGHKLFLFHSSVFLLITLSHLRRGREASSAARLKSHSAVLVVFYFVTTMWSTFLVTDEEGRTVNPAAGTVGVAAGGPAQGPGGLTNLMTGRSTFGGNKRRRTTSTGHAMSEAQEGKIKLAFFVAIVGVVLTVLGVGTEFWVELAPPKSFYNNQTCLTAHYGLWKGCTKTLWVADIDPERESCGPAELPGEANCTYFKFFTTGENAVLFQKTTQKNLNVATAMLSLFSLFLMVMGAICITMALSKEILFFLKPASICFILSGVMVLLALLVFHQSVMAFLASDHTVPLHHELSWSVSCIGCAGAVLIVGGILFLLLALPYSPWQRCLPHKDGGS